MNKICKLVFYTLLLCHFMGNQTIAAEQPIAEVSLAILAKIEGKGNVAIKDKIYPDDKIVVDSAGLIRLRFGDAEDIELYEGIYQLILKATPGKDERAIFLKSDHDISLLNDTHPKQGSNSTGVNHDTQRNSGFRSHDQEGSVSENQWQDEDSSVSHGQQGKGSENHGPAGNDSGKRGQEANGSKNPDRRGQGSGGFQPQCLPPCNIGEIAPTTGSPVQFPADRSSVFGFINEIGTLDNNRGVKFAPALQAEIQNRKIPNASGLIGQRNMNASQIDLNQQRNSRTSTLENNSKKTAGLPRAGLDQNAKIGTGTQVIRGSGSPNLNISSPMESVRQVQTPAPRGRFDAKALAPITSPPAQINLESLKSTQNLNSR